MLTKLLALLSGPLLSILLLLVLLLLPLLLPPLLLLLNLKKLSPGELDRAAAASSIAVTGE